MAVTTTNRVAGPFVGNGVTVVFGFYFKVFATMDLLVVTADQEGNAGVLALGLDYTATLNANQDVSPGGLITLATALPTGTVLVITSDVAELQQVVLTNLGGFYPDVLNGVFDRLTILVQQLQVTASRSLQFPLTDGTSGSGVLPPAAQRAGTLLYFDGNGNILPLSVSAIVAMVAAATPSNLIQDGVTKLYGFISCNLGKLTFFPISTGKGTPTAIVFADTVGNGTNYALLFNATARELVNIGTLGAPVAGVKFADQANGNYYTLQVTNGAFEVLQTSSAVGAVASWTLADITNGALRTLTFNNAALVD